MAIEIKLIAIPPTPLTSNGTAAGALTVSDACRFKVLQVVILQSSTAPAKKFEVKRITDPIIYLGPIDRDLSTRSDISNYLVADGASLSAEEQLRPFIPDNAVDRISEELDKTEHEEEPAVAKRSILVDKCGEKIDSVLSGGKRRLAVDIFPTSGGGGSTLPTTPTIANIAIAIANAEQSYALPASTMRFLIRIRESAAKMQLAFILGDSGANFITVRRGSFYVEQDIDPASSVTLYFQSDLAPATAEIISWK